MSDKDETLQWIKDWREGMFSSTSRDEEGWPIEMHGLAASYEELAKSPRMSDFVDPDNPKYSVLVCPTPNNNWWWSVFSGDGSEPGSLKRGSAALSLAEALEEAAEWVRNYNHLDRGSADES